MKDKKLYVQYGCGLSAPEGWLNFDASPTLRVQRIPFVGRIIKKNMRVSFPDNVIYGDIVKGLPVAPDSCYALYCSHVLEHLSLLDFRVALKNSFRILMPGGVFRCVLPDLEYLAKKYIAGLQNQDASASIDFIGNGTLLGTLEKPKGLKSNLQHAFGNSKHLWMWDYYSLSSELKAAGFKNIVPTSYGKGADEMFRFVEDESRFDCALAIECTK